MEHPLTDDLRAAYGHRITNVCGGQRMSRITLDCTLDFDAVSGEIEIRIGIETEIEGRQHEIVHPYIGGSELTVAVECDDAEHTAALLPL